MAMSRGSIPARAWRSCGNSPAVYGQAGRPPELLARIRTAVAGEAALEAALEEHLTPRPAMLEHERKRAEREAKRQEERDREEKDRNEWIARLRANPGTVGDLSIAAEGKVWRNTVWLFEEMRGKGKGSSGSWTVARWERLEEEFGPEVAGRFKDFCIAFWRRYTPALRSEVGGDSRTTPWPIIIGLSGLAMEARGKDWERGLSEEEVRLAVRYALLGFGPQLPAHLRDQHLGHGRPMRARQARKPFREAVELPHMKPNRSIQRRVEQGSPQQRLNLGGRPPLQHLLRVNRNGPQVFLDGLVRDEDRRPLRERGGRRQPLRPFHRAVRGDCIGLMSGVLFGQLQLNIVEHHVPIAADPAGLLPVS
jgi:hypothetical protein